jgi:hypothetical protein
MCTNFVMSDTHLAIEQRDLFTANQILHLKPMIGAELLEGFVAANPFVRRFYPNRQPPSPPAQPLAPGAGIARIKRALEIVLALPSPALEWICRRVYAWHLRRRSTAWSSPDQVSLRADSLKLHTRSHRQSVLARFDERMEAALGEAEHAAIA